MVGQTAAWQVVAATKATRAPGVVLPPRALFRETVLNISGSVRQLWQVNLCETPRSQVPQCSWNPKHVKSAEINARLTIDSGRTISKHWVSNSLNTPQERLKYFEQKTNTFLPCDSLISDQTPYPCPPSPHCLLKTFLGCFSATQSWWHEVHTILVSQDTQKCPF